MKENMKAKRVMTQGNASQLSMVKQIRKTTQC